MTVSIIIKALLYVLLVFVLLILAALRAARNEKCPPLI